MNLYEYEGKQLFSASGIAIPRGVVVRNSANAAAAYRTLHVGTVMVKAQIMSGKRGKVGGVLQARDEEAVVTACQRFFAQPLNGHDVTAVLIEERLPIARECYASITFDTRTRTPVFLWSEHGGGDIEEGRDAARVVTPIDMRAERLHCDYPYAQALWNCFRKNDLRLAEINPLIETTDGRWVAADAKVAIDDDAFFRHDEWREYTDRSSMGRVPTQRELAVRSIDAGEHYYRGTASKYIEMDGDVAVLFSGGGASIANIDAMQTVGLAPANYTEYSGNPPREKVAALSHAVLTKEGLRGLWIAGGVANFTNIAETFKGIIDTLDVLRPSYPIVVRRAGPHDDEGMALMRACAKRHGLRMRLFGKDVSMSASVRVLADMIYGHID